MIKAIFAFVVFFLIFYFVIASFREMTGKEKWKLTKYIAYSTMCAVLTMALLISIVIIF